MLDPLGYVPPPKRDGQYPLACPPFTGKYVPPDPAIPGDKGHLKKVKLPANGPKDKPVGGGLENDYYRGEWRFEDDQHHNLIVREWCIQQEPVVDARGEIVSFEDYIGWEIYTSEYGVETLRVSPEPL